MFEKIVSFLFFFFENEVNANKNRLRKSTPLFSLSPQEKALHILDMKTNNLVFGILPYVGLL